MIEAIYDITLLHQTRALQLQSSNPLNKCGHKCFSQADEDGITLEILRRMGELGHGVFAEFGVGDGMENNSLILAALGWKGFWVGGEELRYTIPEGVTRFKYQKEWITRDNVVDLTRKGLSSIGESKLDVVSLDLDGNDIYLVENLLKTGFHPKLFIVEYNAKFPPPVEFRIEYNDSHQWQSDDYFGASLASFNKVFGEYKYKLVCCNSHTGANAFYIAECYADRFADIPNDVNEIFMPPRYWQYKQFGHPSSLKTIRQIFATTN